MFRELKCYVKLAEKLTGAFSPDDTVKDLKLLIAAQTGTKPEKIVLKKWLVSGCLVLSHRLLENAFPGTRYIRITSH